jgi:hypothetical protein
MSKWIKTVEVDDIEDDKLYFIGRRSERNGVIHLFWSRPLRGKNQWSVKPGIAIQYVGNDDFRETLKKNPIAIAIKVPVNADKLWRARKANFNKK